MRRRWGPLNTPVTKLLIEALGRKLKPAGFKKANAVTWYRRNDETVSVLNLQRSLYGAQYFVNVAIWLNALGDVSSPREQRCHIRFRWEKIVQADDELLSVLTDFEDESMTDEVRSTQIAVLLERDVLPFFARTTTLRDIKDFHKSNAWLKYCATRDAAELLGLNA